MLKKWLLPGGMIAAAGLSFLMPRLGITLESVCGTGIFIVLIFFICGWQADFHECRFDRKLVKNFLFSGIFSMLAAPWIAWGTARLLKLDAMASAGLIVILAMPPTLSSGIVMAANAGGNTLAGMLFTVLFNLAGVFTLPVMLTYLLAGTQGVESDPVKMFVKLLLLVVLPFFAGALARKKIPVKLPSWTGHVPSFCVILLALSFFSMANEHLKQYPLRTLLLLAVTSLLFRIGLLAGLWYGGRLLKADRGIRIAMIFTAGSKTLTISLATLAILKLSGEAMVPCILFYFIQVFLDSSLSGKLAGRQEKNA